MKKMVILCSALLIGCFALSAGQHPTLNKKHGTQYQNHEERLSKVEKHLQLDTKYYDYLSSYAANMYINADFLYWTAENDAWFHGQLSSGTEPGSGPVWPLVRKLEYGPGVRLGLGFKTCYDWDIYGSWTYLDNKTNLTTTGGLHSILYIPLNVNKVATQYKIKYNMLDLELGRAFHAGNTLSLRPHIGLRGGWINQSGFINADEDLTVPIGTITTPIVVNFSEKTWVIGPRAGFDTNLYFGNTGLSIYGNLAAALLYGKIDANVVVDVYYAPAAAIAPLFDYRIRDDQDIFSTLQIALGLAWGDFVNDNESVALNVHAGWEANYWWNQFQAPLLIWSGSSPASSTVTEPIIMQGLVVGARLDF